MVSIDGLHEENLVKIFRHLTPSTPWHWLSCKVVCKEWSRLADMALQHLYLRGGRQLPLNLLLQMIPRFSHLCILSIFPQALTEVTEDFFLLVSISCPQLEVFHLHHRCPLQLTARILSPLFSNCSKLVTFSLAANTSTITLPQSLGELKTLRLLELTCQILEAPHSFSSLHKLESLTICAGETSMAPGFPCGLSELHRLTVPYGVLDLEASRGKLSNLRELCLVSGGEWHYDERTNTLSEALAESLQKLERLEFDVDDDEFPSLMQLPWNKLRNVEYLGLKTSNILSDDLKRLGGWDGLRSLKIASESFGLEVERGDDSENSEDFDPSDEEVEIEIKSLKLLLSQITQLDIEVHTFDMWRGALPFVNITKLKLEGVGDHEMFSEILDGLDKLKELYLGHVYGLTKLWSVDNLKSLCNLSIVKCRKLTKLPDLRKLTKLKSLVLSHNEVLEVTTMSESEFNESVASIEVLCIEGCPRMPRRCNV